MEEILELQGYGLHLVFWKATRSHTAKFSHIGPWDIVV